jgi:uncharacterized SAM-binding protein YcdF (DUF218 family)
MFILKKIISAFLLPFNVSISLLAVGVFLLFATRFQRVAKAFILIGFLFFLFLSMPPTANWLANSLEHRYSSPAMSVLQDPQIRWIVVLGGGHNSSMPPGQQLSGSSMARLVEGVRIFCMREGRTLFLSGGSVYDPKPNAAAMADEAKTLGINQKDLMLESQSRDTEEQAEFLAPILRQEPFFLITSAVHMPRAMALFMKKGMKPIAVPCDFSFVPKNPPALLRILPNASSLQQSERAFRERMGMLYSLVRGKV